MHSGTHLIIGIDPGARGGWAILDGRDGGPLKLRAAGRLHAVQPATQVAGRRVFRRVLLSRLLDDLGKVKGQALGVQEKPQTRQNEGEQASLANGWNAAVSYCALTFRCHVVKEVTGAQWKPDEVGGGPDGKIAAEQMCRRLFPEQAGLFADHGVADAVLIARYAALHLWPRR